MSTNNDKLFSTAMFGFQKAEVVEYLEKLNGKALLVKEQSEFEISRLQSEVNELEGRLHQAEEALVERDNLRTQLASAESDCRILRDDTENQKHVITTLEDENASLKAHVAELEAACEASRTKAERYETEAKQAGGILDNAKKSAAEIVENARRTAESTAERIRDESEQLVAANVKKVKYLYKRRDELLSAFEKVKDAAGGFYDDIANALRDDETENG